MIDVKPWSKKGAHIIWDYDNRNYGDIDDAYVRPSSDKRSSYRAIERRALATEGYNNDLKVVGKSCHFYSTVYTYDEDGVTYIVKDTVGGTYRTILV